MFDKLIEAHATKILITFLAAVIGWVVWLNIANANMRTDIANLETLVDEQDATIKMKDALIVATETDLEAQIEDLIRMRAERDELELTFKLYRDRVKKQITDLEKEFYGGETADKKLVIEQAIKENAAAYTEMRLKASEIIRSETLSEYCTMFPEQDQCRQKPVQETSDED